MHLGTRIGRLTIGALFAGGLLYAPTSFAGKSNDTLVYASDSEPESVSPYHNDVREGVTLARLAWDTLIYRDPRTGEYRPMLATAWKWLDPLTLDVELRQGVGFQNGDKFSADDVVFTFNYVVNPESKVVTKQNVDWIKSAEKRGDYEVRIHLKTPFPAALEYLAGPTPIYPKAYFQKVGGVDGYSRAPIGTGPYKIVSVALGKGVKLERNANYFKDSPRGQPSIGKLEFRVIPDHETQVAELMTGGIDWIWRVPPDQADALKANPKLTVVAGETMRVGYLAFDNEGRADAKSPFKEKRVREAISYAIDRQAMVQNLVKGSSHVMDAFCFPSQFGCQPDAVRKYSYDPAKAKALLAEAGYKDGFDAEIYAYREREYAEAMIGYLRAVGIRAKLNFLKYSALREAQRAGKVPLGFLTWASFSVNDASAMVGVFFKGGDDDFTHDKQIIDWLNAADSSTDPVERKANYAKALGKIAEEAYALPLFSYSSYYAFTSDLQFTPDADEVPRFDLAHWK